MPGPDAPRPRPSHLLDPDDLHSAHRSTTGSSGSLTRVQQWVMSALAVTTILHLAAGVVVAAVLVEPDRLDARIGLNVLGGVFGVLAVAAALLIHRRNPLSWWLLLGPLPGVVGAWLTFA